MSQVDPTKEKLVYVNFFLFREKESFGFQNVTEAGINTKFWLVRKYHKKE